MQPHVVGEVGCAQGGVALAVFAVAGGAGGELFLAPAGAGGVMRAAREAEHVLGQVAHVLRLAHGFGHGINNYIFEVRCEEKLIDSLPFNIFIA